MPAVGNPPGLASSVTEGIISATGRAVSVPASQRGIARRDAAGAIQASAATYRGNRGCALASTSGQLIGIPAPAAVSRQTDAPAPGIGRTWFVTSPGRSSHPGT